MRKYLLGFVCLLGLTGVAQADNFTLNISAGYLTTTAGAGDVPAGGLLQLIASPSGTFGAPNSSSYISGDNVLIASFAMSAHAAGAPETNNTLSAIPFSNSTYIKSANNSGYGTGIYTVTVGEKFELRFYPSLTYNSQTNYSTSAPTLGTSYGEVRADTIEFGAAGGDSNETTWVIPASGGNVDVNYITVSDGGKAAYTNMSAQANSFVLVGVPEPSTYAMFIGGFAGLLSLHMRNRRKDLQVIV